MLTEKPEAIMINIPLVYFGERWPGEMHYPFSAYYETMGTDKNPDGMFYHFISTVPVHQVTHAFVCFFGEVRYKAVIVEFLKNKPVMLPSYQHPEPRNWMVTTGPVVKAPDGMIQKGFRGFRYCKMLF